MFDRARDWFRHRFGLDLVRAEVLNRRSPTGGWYYGDGAAVALLLGVQVVTGMTLALSYSPAPDRAYASVQYISGEMVLGWLVRALHYWSAGFMVLMLVWHVLRQLLLGGYKSPREGTWLVGVALFLLVWVMSVTGYMLRWDQTGVSGLRVALRIFSYVPLIGGPLVRFVQGGDAVSGATLSRLFAAHVVILPLLILGLAAWHIYLVIRHGVTSVSEREGEPIATAGEQRAAYERDAHSPERGETFYPDTTFSSGAFAGVVLAVVVVLALTLGAPALLDPAGAVPHRTVPREEWWFSWWSGMAGIMPSWLAPWVYVLLPVVLIVVLVALPIIDRSSRRGMRRRPVAVACVVLIAVGLLALSDVRRRSPWHAYPMEGPLPLPPSVTDLPEPAEQGRQLFAAMGCTSCHSVAGHGRSFGPDLSQPSKLYSHAELVAYIARPPPDVPMPAYETRATPEQIDLLAAYVLAAQTFPTDRRP